MLEWDLNWPVSRKSLFSGFSLSLSLSLSLSPVFLVLCVAETVVPGFQMRRKAEETERSFTEEGDLCSFQELKSLEKLVIWRFQYLKRSLPNFVFSSVAAEGFLISSCWRFGVTFFNGVSSSAGMIVLFCFS